MILLSIGFGFLVALFVVPPIILGWIRVHLTKAFTKRQREPEKLAEVRRQANKKL